MPPLEAMSFGVPVVASRASCIRDVLGNAAVYCNPESTADIAQKIMDVLQNPTLRDELREKGLAQTKKYSWERMAEETLQTYASDIG